METHRRLTRTKLWIIVIPITTFRFPFCAFELTVASCTPLVPLNWAVAQLYPARAFELAVAQLYPARAFCAFCGYYAFCGKKMSEPLSYPFII